MRIKLLLLFLASLLSPAIALCFKPSGLGEVAENLMDPVSALTSFVITGSQIAGVAFLFGGLVRFVKYRTNPVESPLSTVVMLFVVGLVLLGIPYVHKLL